MDENFSLIIAGVGGQGSILASHVIGDAALEIGFRVIISETYGGAQRGGPVFSLIKIGKSLFSPLPFEESLDVLIGLEPLEALRLAVRYLSPSGIAIVNVKPINPIDVTIGKAKYPDVNEIISSLKGLCRNVYYLDALECARKAGNVRAANMAMLGALVQTKLLPIPIKAFQKAILMRVPKGTEELNLRAFEMGQKAVELYQTERTLRESCH